MYLRQCFARGKPFPVKKSQILSGVFLIFKKSQNFNIWLQKSQMATLLLSSFYSHRQHRVTVMQQQRFS